MVVVLQRPPLQTLLDNRVAAAERAIADRRPYDAEALDRNLLVAMRTARQHHLSLWHAALLQHRNHPTFLLADDPIARTLGFFCNCDGQERTWSIPLTDLRDALPEMREGILGWRDRYYQRATTREKKRQGPADKRARALFFRYLTRAQKWELRAHGFITVVGQDGKTYIIMKALGHSVRLLEDGEERYSFCVVAKTRIPEFDLMLALKLLLEVDLRTFYKTAHVTDCKTKKWYLNGLPLLGEAEEPEPPPTPSYEVIPIPNDDIERPEGWARAQLAEAQVHLPVEEP